MAYPNYTEYVSPDQYAQIELESEYRAQYDDHQERWASEALDNESEYWDVEAQYAAKATVQDIPAVFVPEQTEPPF